MTHTGLFILVRAVQAAAFLTVGSIAIAGKPTSAPLLQLETGMHTANVGRIATDAGSRWAVTVSDDKTARVWDLASGQLVRVLRPPQDAGSEGSLDGVAVSPDGAVVAVAGWTGYDWDGESSIYVFDRASGRMQRRISAGRGIVGDLAYSPDGRYLAVALTDNQGVRLFDMETASETGRDVDYQNDVLSLDFSLDGRRLVTSSLDGGVRLYAVERGALRRLLVARPNGGKRPYATRFSPDGRLIAMGHDDTWVVQVLDAGTLQEVARPSTAGITLGSLAVVSWTKDGRSLMAGGKWDIGGKSQVRRWSVGDWSRYADTPVSTDTVMDLRPLADGRVLFATRDPSWGILSAEGKLEWEVRGVNTDFRGPEKLRLSADGRQVRFSFGDRETQASVFDISERSLRPDVPGLQAARTDAPGLKIVWKETEEPSLNGRPLVLSPGERSHALAITPDGQHFALGSDWWLRFYDRTGKVLWRTSAPGSVWAVNVSADGRWVVAAYADGTIRWHRPSDGQETIAFFPHADRKRWIAWTPEGFFDVSLGAEEMIGYHLNRSQDQEGEFVSARQFRDRFYQPWLIARRLDSTGSRLLAEAVRRIGDIRQFLTGPASRTPLIEVVTSRQLTGEEEVTVTVRVRDQGGGIGRVVFYIDGQPQDGRQAGGSVEGTISRSFPLLPGAVRGIAVAATNSAGVEGPREHISALVTGTKKDAALHVLAVGIETYRDPNLQLRHSARDAQRVAEQLAAGGKRLFNRGVTPVVLKNEEATLVGIERAFADLARNIQPQDTMVIFLAGHGEAPVGKNYTFLPWDFRRGDSGPAGQGLNEERLRKLLAQSPSQTLLLLDTCDAGGAVEMIQAAYERLYGISKHVVIGASRRGEFAMEGYDGHGVFTAALLKTLQSKPADEHDRILHVTDIRSQVRREVDRIVKLMGSNYRQHISGFLGSADFPLVAR